MTLLGDRGAAQQRVRVSSNRACAGSEPETIGANRSRTQEFNPVAGFCGPLGCQAQAGTRTVEEQQIRYFGW